MAGRPKGTALNGRVRYFTDGELEAFMKAARRHGAKWAALWGLTYHFALRVGEAVSLRLADFDMNAHQVRIKAEKGGLTRVYDLPEKLEKAVKAWLRERAALEWADENPFLFPSRDLPRTEHMTGESGWKLFQATCRLARLETKHSPHDLRHTCASQMVRAGSSIVQVARWLRHRNAASCERYLADIGAAEHERSMEQMTARFL